MYLDDGFAVASVQPEAMYLASCLKRGLGRCGFLINEAKSNLVPHQHGEYLGYIIDLHQGRFLVPEDKVQNLIHMIESLLNHPVQHVLARRLAQVTGTIISMGLALGHVARLFTRHMYVLINSVPLLQHRVLLSKNVLGELAFWLQNFTSLAGQPIWRLSPKIDVITYSDASSSGWAGYAVQLGNFIAKGAWGTEDAQQSSTFRELKAVRLVLETFARHLQNKECKHRSDNQSTISIMAVGSNKECLQKEATMIYAICRQHGIRLFPEWVPRNLNTRADYWSKVIDTDDWMLNPVHFRELMHYGALIPWTAFQVLIPNSFLASTRDGCAQAAWEWMHLQWTGGMTTIGWSLQFS